jgi:hypothetical protein
MKLKSIARNNRCRPVSRLPEPLEPRQLLSATLLSALGFGSDGLQGQSIAAIAVDATGNLYVAGTFTGTMDVDPSANITSLTASGTLGSDIFLLKYSVAGELVFAHSFASTGEGTNNARATDLKLNGTGSVMLTGSFTSTIDMDPTDGVSNLTSAGGADAFVAQFDTDGNLVWAKSFGGAGDDVANKIESDRKGGFYLLGNFQQTADLDPGVGTFNATASTNWDVFLSRINADGDLRWSNQFTASDELFFADIAVDNSGSVYTAGFLRGVCDFKPNRATKFLGSEDEMLGFAAKYNSSGNLVWAKSFGEGQGNPNASALFVYDIALDSKRNVILAGSFGGTVDVNPGGRKHNLSDNQSPDAFSGYLLKLSNVGAYVWSGALTGDSWSDAYSVMTDASNNIYLAGELNGTNTFDITGSSPNDTLTSRGQDDAFLAKYDSAGRLMWVEQVGGTGYDHGLHVALGPNSNFYMAGYFNDMAHFGPLVGGVDLTAVGVMDSFISVYSQAPTAVTVALATNPDVPQLGKFFTVIATVSAPQGIVSGKVTIKLGTRTVGTGTLNADGTMTARLRLNNPGSYTFTASYLGNSDFAAATGTLSLTL